MTRTDKTSSGRIVVLTASIGTGHDGAALAWADRLRASGFTVEVHDLLGLLPVRISRGLSNGYQAVLDHAAWLWAGTFALTSCRGGRAAAIKAVLPQRYRLLSVIPEDTAAVLCTYPLAGQLLGRLRQDGDLSVPVISFLTDMAVHPLCVAPGVDLHLALHEDAAGAARRLGAGRVAVSGPVLTGRFMTGTARARDLGRTLHGLPATERVALLVAGPSGVGDLARSAADVRASGVAVPVIACGSDERLFDRLSRSRLGIPLRWVDDMDLLLRSVDVLVENAGGLASLEALAAGVPVATYRPVAGHGRANAAALARAGLSTWIRGRRDVGPALLDLMDGPRGAWQIGLGQDLFQADPVEPLAQLLS